MRRREFIGALGGTVLWPLTARAQKKLPLVGLMDLSGQAKTEIMKALAANGLVEGRDFTVESTWGAFDPKQWTAQASDFVGRGAAVILTTSQAAPVAKAVTQSVPIVFTTPGDPVANGLVQSLNRPGGNLTGVTLISSELVAKRLEVLRELVPEARSFAYLGNPTNIALTPGETAMVQTAASALGVRLVLLEASSMAGLDAAFRTITTEAADALIVSGDSEFFDARVYILRKANAAKLPAIFATREHVELGALTSYGASQVDGWYTMGVYAARILKGEKPSQLPVQQVAKVEFLLNLRTARTLGLAVPPGMLARATEVIE